MYSVIEKYTKIILVKGSLEYCKNWLKNNCTIIDENGVYCKTENEVIFIREF
jgi:hypothetical protein